MPVENEDFLKSRPRLGGVGAGERSRIDAAARPRVINVRNFPRSHANPGYAAGTGRRCPAAKSPSPHSADPCPPRPARCAGGSTPPLPVTRAGIEQPTLHLVIGDLTIDPRSGRIDVQREGADPRCDKGRPWENLPGQKLPGRADIAHGDAPVEGVNGQQTPLPHAREICQEHGVERDRPVPGPSCGAGPLMMPASRTDEAGAAPRQ
jgi:hypothetical protein